MVWLPELGDSSQTLSRPSDRKTQQDTETGQDRHCRRPPHGCSWSSWRTAGIGWERGRYYNKHSPLIPTIQQFLVTLTLEALGWSAEVLSAQGMDTVAFTQLDVAISQIVSAGQQCVWSSQHSACQDSRNILTTKVLKLLSHRLNDALSFYLARKVVKHHWAWIVQLCSLLIHFYCRVEENGYLVWTFN